MVDRTIDNQAILAQEQQRSLNNQQRVVDALPHIYKETAAIAIEECRKRVDVNIQLLKARIDASEQELRNQFEQQAWNLISESFPAQFEAIYLTPVNALIERENKALIQLDEKRRRLPNDAPTTVAYYKKKVQVASLSQVAFKDQAELMFNLMEKLETVRGSINQTIQYELDKVRNQADDLSDGACIASETVPDQLVKLQNQMGRLHDPIMSLHNEQKAALETVGAYINRKSPVELVIVGAGLATKEKLGSLNRLVDQGLAGLQSAVSGAGQDLIDTVEAGSAAVNRDLDLIFKRISSLIDSELDDLSENILTGASKMTGKVLKN
ncbi:hypothetical protein [uncultured Desulfosarcina sp.]|uniref:hypothetical protein n=1 Tax=uncultured Desulfosarcina sp. TaxID=218289 RepID=UPI0029C63D5D|nr:hypothetical protein [uncultured Desulfosarcina sp.]